MIRSQKQLNDTVGIETEQELSQSDKLLVGYHKSASWFANNRQKVIGGAVIIVAIIAALFIWRSKQQEEADHAEALVTRIMGAYSMNNWRMAIDGDATVRIQNEPLMGFRQIAADYGSTKAGQSAKLCLGNCYYYLGKLDSALMAYDGVSSDIPLIRSAADAGKAAILEDKGNKEEAAKLFISAASVEVANPLNVDYSYAAARNLEAAGKKDEAIKLYRKIMEDNQGTYFDDGAKRALLRLGVSL